nr:hypothetical protein [Tanacetum cinerariifolium]
MTSANICLAINQNFNFSKYIFDHMMKNLEGEVKFLMFPRFVQVLLDSKVEDLLKHKEIYVTPSHTNNIFANMKRQGKDFFGKVTPLFETMMVQPQEDIDEHVTTTFNDPLLSGEDRLKLSELMELCTHLQSRVLALYTTKAGQALEIKSLKIRDMLHTSIFNDEEVVAIKEVSTADPVPTAGAVVTTTGVKVSTAAITSQISMDGITLAKALIDVKTSKPKAKGIVMQEL